MKAFSLQPFLESYSWLFKIVFYMTLVTGCFMAFTPVEGGMQAKFNDKLLHVVGFFVMALMSQLAHPKTPFIALCIGLSCFGLAIELIQAYLPYRSFSLWDFAADVFGLTLYFSVFARFLRGKSLPD